MVQRKPNFFIVGARKTGTTSLYHYLKGHPEVFMPPVKEPHYFSKQLSYHIHLYSNEEEYLSLFKNSEGKQAIGEASTSYLDEVAIPSEISQFNPNAKIIILLRDLVELAYSMHFEFAFRGRAIEDFRKELELQKNSSPDLDYLRIIKNMPAVIRSYIHEFGNKNVHIINYQNFRDHGSVEFSRILEFLEIDSSYKPEFKQYNTSSKPKSKMIASLLNSKLVQSIGKLVYRYLPGGNGMDPFFWNKEAFTRPSMPEDLKESLSKELESTRKELETLLETRAVNYPQNHVS